MKKYLLITGGAGFIGSTLVKHLLLNTDYNVVNLDKLTYASNLDSLKEVENLVSYNFIQGDISDAHLVKEIFSKYRPCAVIHLAAESHVDRSIHSPTNFIQTNIVGTFNLIQNALDFWESSNRDPNFRFLHVSTDEVYGSLEDDGLFSESSRYDPSSPYSASKAAADHLVKAWGRTYGLPILVTNCSNNFGPFQFPEKLIPLTIQNAINGKKIPVYGNGKQVRDWLYVEDHARALIRVLEKGEIHQTYNIGGDAERKNIEVVKLICDTLDHLLPDSKYKPHAQLISYVSDRPGHDKRYAIDCSKIKKDLNWIQDKVFEDALKKTIEWYVANQNWVKIILDRKEFQPLSGLSV